MKRRCNLVACRCLKFSSIRHPPWMCFSCFGIQNASEYEIMHISSTLNSLFYFYTIQEIAFFSFWYLYFMFWKSVWISLHNLVFPFPRLEGTWCLKRLGSHFINIALSVQNHNSACYGHHHETHFPHFEFVIHGKDLGSEEHGADLERI